MKNITKEESPAGKNHSGISKETISTDYNTLIVTTIERCLDCLGNKILLVGTELVRLAKRGSGIGGLINADGPIGNIKM